MVYMFLENGFEETEAIGALDFILRSGIEIKTVSTHSEVIGTHGITVKPDLSVNDIKKEGLLGIVLPGGMPGTSNLEANPVVCDYIEYCYKNNLMLAAICAAPSIFGHMGYLEGKNAVCYPTFKKDLKGAYYSEKKAVADENIITGKAMGAVLEFGYKIVEYLKDKNTADEVMESIYG